MHMLSIRRGGSAPSLTLLFCLYFLPPASGTLHTLRRLAPVLEAVGDRAEDIPDLRSHQDQNGDDHNGDQCNDERVFHQSLTTFGIPPNVVRDWWNTRSSLHWSPLWSSPFWS